jgi:hypothetical protein
MSATPTGCLVITLPSKTSCVRLVIAMPCQPRLDALDTLYHVMVRGIERMTLFRDDPDLTDIVLHC